MKFILFLIRFKQYSMISIENRCSFSFRIVANTCTTHNVKMYGKASISKVICKLDMVNAVASI